VTAFWRRQRRVGNRHDRERGEVEFAHWRQVTFDAALTVRNSDSLSEPGLAFLSAMCDRLADWQDQPVSNRADSLAAEMISEHRTRWRLAHLSPDAASIDRLAQAWIGASSSQGWADTPVTVDPTEALLPSRRSTFLEISDRAPASFQQSQRTKGELHDADIALTRRDDSAASQRVLERIESGHDLDAWAGFLFVRQRQAPPAPIKSVLQRPEVIVALYTRILALSNIAPEPDALIAWLAETSRSTSQPPAS
jgi:hypothetical protein